MPAIQHWSCHSCSGCCRQHLIEVTDAERERIAGLAWSAEDGLPAEGPLVVPFAGPPWKRRYRLAHQSDGACVFLDEKGLCRIHAKFGEAAKPLACRVYPYAFHPAGKEITVSLRFSCPSVVADRGLLLTDARSDVRRVAEEVVPQKTVTMPPPAVHRRQRVEWPDFLRFVDALDATLAADDGSAIAVRLLRALFWIDLVDQSRFEQIAGSRLRDFLSLIVQAARDEAPADLSTLDEPTRTGRLYFRMHAAQYARRDTAADLDAGLLKRWRLLRAAIRFARGRGEAPPLHPAFQPVPFDRLEQPFGGVPDEADEILTRYFRVKVQGLHFCGPAYYEVPLVEGFRSLALVYPVVIFLARWLAAGAGRATLTTADVSQALAVADHHHGYSAALGHRTARRRVRGMAAQGDIPRLCGWYSR
ncbi:MAG: YkgJ family cysteine cluster protein [Planctomycetes bacterium]|nr:YkgJ family cysteine cluster protein [Planctomycetota bacterium]